MNVEIMREIVDNTDKKRELKKELDILSNYKNNMHVYGYDTGVTIKITTGPSFHDKYTDVIKTSLDDELVDALIDKFSKDIDKLEEKIKTLENKLENK